MKQKTTWTTEAEIERKWYVVDLDGKVLGRAATKIAGLLIGKSKVNYVPNLDCGDYVIVLNAAKVKLTRDKGAKKTYYSHSGYPGGFKEITFDKLMLKRPTEVITRAVHNMLPKNKLNDRRMARLFIYDGAEHNNTAQKPVEFKL